MYIYFKREEMEDQLGLSERTVSKVLQELKTFFLVEEKQQGLNKPNKIYLLSPIIGDDASSNPYLDPDNDYDPEKSEYECYAESCIAEPVVTTEPDTQDLRSLTRNNYASEPVIIADTEGVNSTTPDPQELRPNKNNLSNSELNKIEKKNNNMSDTEASKTAAAVGG